MLPAVTTQSLPALVQRAASQLTDALGSAEILEARGSANFAYDAAKMAGRFAKAKGAHDELIDKARRAQADALEIMALANRRIADEYDAAQERGEVRAANTGRSVSALETPSFTNIGLTGKEVHEARQIRDAEEADPGVVRRTLDEALDAGKEPTKALVRRAIAKPRERPTKPRKRPTPAGKQLEKLRQAWREASPMIREHFLAEITRKAAA